MNEVNGKIQEEPQAKYQLVLCDADLLKDSWPFIRKGLLAIKRKDKRSGQWIPEHVRQRIEAGLMRRIFCECYLCVDQENNPIGFCVLTMDNDIFVGVPLSLFMWITYLDPHHPLRVVMPHVKAFLLKRKRDLGCLYLDGISSRFGWMKELTRHGFRVHQYIFRHEEIEQK